MISAGVINSDNITSAVDPAIDVRPLFGKFPTWFISIGLLAAGITSSIIAPLAATYVVKEFFGWERGLKSLKFKAVWFANLLYEYFSPHFS